MKTKKLINTYNIIGFAIIIFLTLRESLSLVLMKSEKDSKCANIAVLYNRLTAVPESILFSVKPTKILSCLLIALKPVFSYTGNLKQRY